MGIDKTSALLQWLEHLKPVFLIYWKHFEEWEKSQQLVGYIFNKKIPIWTSKYLNFYQFIVL